jgi:hypothetical protein
LDKTAKSLQLYEQYKKQKKKRSKPSSWEITHCSLFSWDISHCLLTSYLIYISSIYCYSSISSGDTSQPVMYHHILDEYDGYTFICIFLTEDTISIKNTETMQKDWGYPSWESGVVFSSILLLIIFFCYMKWIFLT